MSLIFNLLNAGSIGIATPPGTPMPNEDSEVYRAIENLTDAAKNLGLLPRNKHRTYVGGLWLELLNKELGTNYLQLATSSNALSFSAADIEAQNNNPDRLRTSNWVRNDASKFNVHVLHIRRGLGFFEAMKTHAEHNHLTHLPGLTSHLIMNKNHRIEVFEFQDVPGVIILTNQTEGLSYAKLISSLWSFMSYDDVTTHFREKTIESSPFLHLCSLLYMDDVPGYKAFLEKLIADYEAFRSSDEYLAEMMAKFTETINRSYYEGIEERIRMYETKIEERTSQLMDLYSQLREAQVENMSKKLLGESNNTAMTEFLAFVKRSNGNIQMIDVDHNESNNFIFDITTPINSYRRKDVEPFFKGGSNMFTNDKYVAHAIKRIFIDEEYSLMTKTRVSVAFAGTATRAGFDIPGNPYMQNPHLREYNCFSNARNEAHKAMTQQNYIAAIAQISTACGTLTFTDGTVMGRFANYMKDAASTDKKLIKNNETGELISIRELYKREKETPANTTSASTHIITTTAEGVTTVDGIDIRAV